MNNQNKRDAYACGVAFKEYYQEALRQNPLYRHLLIAMQQRENWLESDWLNALEDLYDYEYECFLQALERVREVADADALDCVKANEFVLYRTQFV